jgi:hypothetical protein
VSDAETLRQAADIMEPFGFVHAAIAEGLRNDAKRLDSGVIPDDLAETLELARGYLPAPSPPVAEGKA